VATAPAWKECRPLSVGKRQPFAPMHPVGRPGRRRPSRRPVQFLKRSWNPRRADDGGRTRDLRLGQPTVATPRCQSESGVSPTMRLPALSPAPCAPRSKALIASSSLCVAQQVGVDLCRDVRVPVAELAADHEQRRTAGEHDAGRCVAQSVKAGQRTQGLPLLARARVLDQARAPFGPLTSLRGGSPFGPRVRSCQMARSTLTRRAGRSRSGQRRPMTSPRRSAASPAMRSMDSMREFDEAVAKSAASCFAVRTRLTAASLEGSGRGNRRSAAAL
jgi:hypothetical protein